MKGGLRIIACAALLFFPTMARADCTLTSSGETRPTGTIIHNADFEVLQVCKNDGTWKAMTPVTDPCDPSESPSPGTTCPDGTIYAGDPRIDHEQKHAPRETSPLT